MEKQQNKSQKQDMLRRGDVKPRRLFLAALGLVLIMLGVLGPYVIPSSDAPEYAATAKGAAEAAKTIAPADSPATRRLLMFGDSLTAGYGLQMSESLPAQLGARLAEKGYDVTVINAGVSGDTTAGGLTRLEWTLRQNPDYVVLALGGNDMLRAINPDVTRDNLAKMLAVLKAREIPVLLAGMRAFNNLGADYAKRYDELYRELAAEHGAVFYPFLLDGVATEENLNLKDGIHPNAQGIAKIVDRILPSVEDLLKRPPAPRQDPPQE